MVPWIEFETVVLSEFSKDVAERCDHLVVEGFGLEAAAVVEYDFLALVQSSFLRAWSSVNFFLSWSSSSMVMG